MLSDWRELRTSPTHLRPLLFGALALTLSAVGVGVWIGKQHPSAPSPTRTQTLRPLALGEVRFLWRGQALPPLDQPSSALPPLEPSELPALPTPTLPQTTPVELNVSAPIPPAAPSLIAPLEQTEEARKAEAEEEVRKAEEEARKAEEEARKAEEEARKAEEEARKAEAEEKARKAEAEEKARKVEEEARKAEEKTRQAEAEKTSRQPKEPSTPRFNLQLKAFRHRAEAVEFVAEISPQLGERAELMYIKSATSKGKPIYRVRMGPFSERAAAEEAQRDYIKRFGKRDAPFISLR